MTDNVSKWLIALVLAMIAGPVLSFVLGAYMPWLLDVYGMSVFTYSNLTISVKLVSIIPNAVICTLWIRSVCIREEIKMGWWCVFGAFFQVVAIAVFFAYLAFQKMKTLDANGAGDVGNSPEINDKNQPQQPTSHSAVRYDSRQS